jgi:hypothetical protein
VGFFSRLFGGGSELEIAQRAWDAKDPAHCAAHLGNALVEDPRSAEAMQLVGTLAASGTRAHDRYARLAGGPGESAGVVALRAALLAKAGEHDEAFPLICDLITTLPDRGFDAWLTRAIAVRRLDPLAACAVLKGRLDANAPESPAYAALLEVLAHVGDRLADERLAFLSIVYTRKRDPAAGVERGRRVFAAMPRFQVAVALYGSLRATGDLVGALAVIREAVRLGSEELSPQLDLGDVLLELGRDEEALVAYEGVLRREPEHAWALPSAMLVRARRGDETASRKLDALAEAGNQRAVEALRHLAGGGGTKGLSAPGSATVNVVAQVTKQFAASPPAPRTDGKASSVTLTLSCLEAPSARRAAEAELQRFGVPIRLVVEVQKIPSPDPRLPIGAVDFVLWRYAGDVPSPAMAKPSPEVASAVAALARGPWNEDAWWDRAGALARELGRDPLPGLLAVMVQPPPAPRGVPEWDWWYRVQVAAALAIARLPDPQRAQTALFTLARGPHDWSGSAAVLAIGEATLRGTIPLADVLALFDQIMKGRPGDGDWCVGPSILEVIDLLEQASASGR